MFRSTLIYFFAWLAFTGFTPPLKAQPPGSLADTSVYRIYGEQFAELLRVRGANEETIKTLLDVYQSNNINSDESLATLFGRLYPANRGIGMLFYFFQQDTLRRVFLIPGAVIEKKIIPVTRNELLQLSIDLNHTLGLYAGADNRMPVKRGLVVTPPPASKGITYQRLIEKASSLLLPAAFDSTYRHLLIIPAMNIGTIPFQLLAPYHDGSLLVDHCSITVSPGIVDLLGLRTKTLKALTNWNPSDIISKKFDENQPDSFVFKLVSPLFISNPAYPGNTDYIFPDLPGAKKEIDSAITHVSHYKLLEGRDAVKDSVLKYIGQSDLVYFATHGMANAENPKKSFLVLSGNDPFLTVEDIMLHRDQFPQFPEMVILSACQTGLGKSMEAGVAGLARSFMLCGSNHVIMSLWNVDDEATCFLMNRFLVHLEEPSDFMPAEPLRKAMLETRKKYPNPTQWASFSSFGIDY
ncbi:MAG: CHAT domain-containing protein [Chitinophagaceae bacterium]